MSTPLRVLIVEDSEDDSLLLLRELREGGFQPVWSRIETAAAMTAALDRQSWDLVIADFTMPGFSGTQALSLLRARDPDLPFIFVSGTIGEEVAVSAMKAGAHDYIIKGNLRRLVPTVERELREAELRREYRRIAARVKYLAYHDLLTDLPNRALLHDRLHQGLAAAHRAQQSLALIILDLDAFKDVNDRLGHRVGDAVLQQLGRRMREALRQVDTVARMGGDEFAVVLPGADADAATFVATRLLSAFELPFRDGHLELSVRGSMGIALYPVHGTTADILMQRADVAMYMAKKTRIGFAVYSREIDQLGRQRLAIGSELARAIDARQIVLRYQPRVGLRDGQVLGLEAVAHWQHAREGLLPPARFFGLAEQSGLMRPISLAAIDGALQACRHWRTEKWAPVVSVSLSPHVIEDERFPDEVAMLVEASGLASPCLGLGVTENLIVADPARARSVLSRWSHVGIRLSIDAFGTGYSSLSYLKTLPLHEIRIDTSFIADLERQGDELLVRSIVDLAHNLGLTVVADGVATNATRDRLAVLGCDAAQGPYFSPPAPFDEMSEWLSTRRASLP